MHLIWAAVVFPAVAGVVWLEPRSRRVEYWATGFWISLGLLIAWIGWQAIASYQPGQAVSPFPWQRLLFFLIRSVELPLLAATVATGMAWGWTRWPGSSGQPNQADQARVSS